MSFGCKVFDTTGFLQLDVDVDIDTDIDMVGLWLRLGMNINFSWSSAIPPTVCPTLWFNLQQSPLLQLCGV
jgi:hypothetical protein